MKVLVDIQYKTIGRVDVCHNLICIRSGDPCAAVKVAKASGVNFILHTVGFGLSKKESAQLQCMAKAGGGEYFQANNSKELLKSARKAVKSKGPGMLKLTLCSNGKPVNAWAHLTGNGSIGLVELTSVHP